MDTRRNSRMGRMSANASSASVLGSKVPNKSENSYQVTSKCIYRVSSSKPFGAGHVLVFKAAMCYVPSQPAHI